MARSGITSVIPNTSTRTIRNTGSSDTWTGGEVSPASVTTAPSYSTRLAYPPYPLQCPSVRSILPPSYEQQHGHAERVELAADRPFRAFNKPHYRLSHWP